jgi:hypothetical protein
LSRPPRGATLAQISADILAIEKEAEGLLDGLLGQGHEESRQIDHVTASRELHPRDDQKVLVTPSQELAFAEVVSLIHAARQRTHQAINTELVGL